MLGLLPLGFAASLSVWASAPSDNASDVQSATRSSPPATTAPTEVAEPPRPSLGQVPPIGPTVTAGIAGERAPDIEPGPDRITEILASFASAGLDPVLVGAGDIADCKTAAALATARIVEAIHGLVFTAGDEAYPDGSAGSFRDCYGPSWGRFRDRTLPAIGNHEYETPGAAGHFEYFGPAAGRPGEAWYSLNVGTWHVIA
jgi:hypothetical protein